MLRRLARWLAAAAVLAALAGYWQVNRPNQGISPRDVDPATVSRTGAPNDFLAAPPGTTQATPDIATKVYPLPANELLARFVAVALAQPRTLQLYTTEPGEAPAFAQRSAIIGFPDYIGARAVAVEGGSAMMVYSRSRYGSYDFGVNRARVEDWLAKLDATM